MNKTQIGSVVDIPGKSLIVIGNTPLVLKWESIEKSAGGGPASSATYIDSPQGLVQWLPRQRNQSLVWAINSQGKSVAWQAKGDGVCNVQDQCSCFYLGVYRIMTNGKLEEIQRCSITAVQFECLHELFAGA